MWGEIKNVKPLSNFSLPKSVYLARCICRNMSKDSSQKVRDGFCIYINTFCQGPVPLVRDENGYLVFETELEAQKEIVDYQMTRLQQFLDGEREYEDAIETEEYIVAVTVQSDGKIVDEHGRCFDPKPD